MTLCLQVTDGKDVPHKDLYGSYFRQGFLTEIKLIEYDSKTTQKMKFYIKDFFS